MEAIANGEDIPGMNKVLESSLQYWQVTRIEKLVESYNTAERL
jgi:hypothetical protein